MVADCNSYVSVSIKCILAQYFYCFKCTEYCRKKQMHLQQVTKAGNVEVWIVFKSCPTSSKLLDQQHDGSTCLADSVARWRGDGWLNEQAGTCTPSCKEKEFLCDSICHIKPAASACSGITAFTAVFCVSLCCNILNVRITERHWYTEFRQKSGTAIDRSVVLPVVITCCSV